VTPGRRRVLGWVRRAKGSWRSRVRAPAGTADYKSVWNRAAARDAVDAIFTGATAEVFESSGEADAGRLTPLAGPDARVLNIGCGIGRVEKYLAPRVGELWGVDISGEMIARARVRLAGLPNVKLRELAVGEFLSAFETGTFDLVFSFLVLQHMEREDAFRYLVDAARILRPGGALSVQFPNLLSPEYTAAFVEGARLDSRSPGRVRAYTEPEVRHFLETAGFRVASLALSAGSRGDAEIYATARTPMK
jgi:SAM-dependent methyltransferase